ncbi:MAG: HAMP domain-containing protein [Clostridiaceae bacterium]|nr:HAMP domain-containing protein [Clostridiaceae bacterium]
MFQFKSIFGKLISAYYLIIIITFILLGSLLFGLLGEYATTEKEEVLRYTGEKVNELTVMLIDNYSPLVERLYRMNLESYGTNTQSLIIVIDKTGEIFAISNPRYSYLEGKKLTKEQYGEILSGKDFKRIGDLKGMFSETVLTIGLPLIYNNQVHGGILLNTPIPEINKMRYEVFKLFMIAVSVALCIAFILIFFLSQRFSSSIKMINKAAKTIANGQFQNRVSIVSEDEIGELAKTFNSMAESLENLEKMRSSFIANVSHELRTPMTTVQGFIEGIIDGTIPPDKQNKYLEIVLDEIKRLARLVHDLLDLAKMESGVIQLDIRKFDINELIRLSIIKFEKKIMSKDLKINVTFEDEQCMVKADMDGIQRVINNLLENAIKFSEEHGSIDIAVTTKGNKVYVSIQDYGIGIDEQELKYIWDRFYKTDKSRSKDKSGAGLGLAIVKNIINHHGQEITVESKLEEYTRFVFTLEKA